MSRFDVTLEKLSSAEDFLSFFGIPFDAHVVSVNRLHILKRCNQYLEKCDFTAMDDDAKRGTYCDCLTRAYADFVHSDAQTEKVFPIFRPGKAFVPLSQVVRTVEN